jgi:PAS domain S-box-containing protein
MSKILIVEDNAESRYMLERLLEAKGHHIITAENGEDALRLARRDPPEVIISDIMMPVMNGFRFCREVKNDAGLRNIPFIFYTATFVEKADEKLAMSLGASRFVVKSTEGERFIRMLDDVLNEHRQGILPVPEEPLEGEDTLLKMYDNSIAHKLAKTVEKLQDERKALIKSERRLKEAQELAHIGNRELDLKNNSMKWSDEIYRILGLKPHEFDASHEAFVAAVHPDDRGFVTWAHKESLAKKMRSNIEYRLLLKDGTVKFVDENFQTIYDDDGVPACSIGTVQDITERKESERALREAYDIINRSSSVAFTWKNQKGWPVEFVSENVERLFGFTAEEFIKGEVSYPGCIHPEDLQRVAEEVTECSSKEETAKFFHEPYRIIAKDGSEKIINDWTFIVRDNEGRITHYKGIVEDITELKKAEEERNCMKDQLQQSQKMEAIGTLAGGVAHDFNNLLTIIIGNADLGLMDLGERHPLRERIKNIKNAANSAASLTRQLLAFSRKQVIKPKVLDVNEVITSTEKMLKRLIGEDVELSAVLEPDPWKIHADQGQIEQVIMNLVVNARDAMPQGGQLTVETANIDLDMYYFCKHGIKEQPPGSYLMLSVSDTGIGMDKETQSHIFEPFFTSKEMGKGTGLGLSTVYGIVKQNSGFIWVYSEPGQGSIFKIYLPKIEGDVKEEKKEQTTVENLSGSETVLIVEDDDSLRKLMRTVLTDRGYKVLDAENGEDAFSISKEFDGPIHLLITDMVMPKVSGKEVAERLQPLNPHMKVIYMSGYTDGTIVHRGVLAPGLNFLEKPFSPGGLSYKMREVLDK